jgi:hypothetical protein
MNERESYIYIYMYIYIYIYIERERERERKGNYTLMYTHFGSPILTVLHYVESCPGSLVLAVLYFIHVQAVESFPGSHFLAVLFCMPSCACSGSLFYMSS